MRYASQIVAVALVLRCLQATSRARIKLITLLVRERVEIQLDNPDVTLVQEERIFIEGATKDAKEGDKATAFLGADWGKFTPIDDELKLYLGVVSAYRSIARGVQDDILMPDERGA